MVIDFYTNFYKRINSTLRPTVGGAGNLTAVHEMTGTLKEPCSITHPVISIAGTPVESSIPAVCTYAYIPKFFRYYFVKDWVWKDGLWEVHLDVDVLATYKTHIGDTYAYIERCAGVASGESSQYYNGYIIDRLYPATNQFTIATTVLSPPWTGYDVEDGCYVLGIISRTSGANVGGAVQYYALTQTQIINLLTYMLNDNFYDSAGFSTINPNSQVSHDLAKCIVNPIQYITSCMWFPCPVSSFTTQSDATIGVGPWTTLGTGKPIYDRVGYRQNFTITIPSHPDSASRGAFLNYSPYSRFTCMLPPFGCFQIDPSYIPSNRQIVCTIQVDGITGKACLQLCREDTTLGKTDFFYEGVAMFGVPIQLAQLTSDYIGAIKGITSAIGQTAIGLASGSAIAGASSALMALDSVGNVLHSLQPEPTSEGVNGSFLAFDRLIGTYPRLTSKFVKIVNEDNTELGRPLCEVRQIKKLSGFVKCGEATVDYTAFDEELNSIHQMLLSGFFWE